MLVQSLQLAAATTIAAMQMASGRPSINAQQTYRPNPTARPAIENTTTIAQSNTNQVPYAPNGWCPFSTVSGQTWWQVRDQTGVISLTPARVPAANETNPRVCSDTAPDLTGINQLGLTPQTLINGLTAQLSNTRQNYLNQLNGLRSDNAIRNAILRTLLGNVQGARFDNWRRRAQNQNLQGEALRQLYREIATGLTTYQLQFYSANGVTEISVP